VVRDESSAYVRRTARSPLAVEGYPTSATGLASGTIARMADRAARGLLNGGNYR